MWFLFPLQFLLAFYLSRSCHVMKVNLELVIPPALAYRMQGLLTCNIASVRKACLLPHSLKYFYLLFFECSYSNCYETLAHCLSPFQDSTECPFFYEEYFATFLICHNFFC